MRLEIYQVDAFTDRVFGGNPAAVCPLDRWLPDAEMQAIAQENNLSETAFFVRRGDDFDLRWFTPGAEVDLCGHATLASAWVIFNRLGSQADLVRFHTRSGPLTVRRAGEDLVMDLPANPPRPADPPPALASALGRAPREVVETPDHYVGVFETEAEVRDLSPDMGAIMALDRWAVIVTAPGSTVDFVSRFFAPRKAVPEDPVTGSAHCVLTPYWARRLDRLELTARQLSPRGGNLTCRPIGDRVELVGRAVPFMQGTIELQRAG